MRRPPRTSRRRTKGELSAKPWRIIERSVDMAKTWVPTEMGERSPLAHTLAGMGPYEVHDDGQGNLYRWRPVAES